MLSILTELTNISQLVTKQNQQIANMVSYFNDKMYEKGERLHLLTPIPLPLQQSSNRNRNTLRGQVSELERSLQSVQMQYPGGVMCSNVYMSTVQGELRMDSNKQYTFTSQNNKQNDQHKIGQVVSCSLRSRRQESLNESQILQVKYHDQIKNHKNKQNYLKINSYKNNSRKKLLKNQSRSKIIFSSSATKSQNKKNQQKQNQSRRKNKKSTPKLQPNLTLNIPTPTSNLPKNIQPQPQTQLSHQRPIIESSIPSTVKNTSRTLFKNQQNNSTLKFKYRSLDCSPSGTVDSNKIAASNKKILSSNNRYVMGSTNKDKHLSLKSSNKNLKLTNKNHHQSISFHSTKIPIPSHKKYPYKPNKQKLKL